MKHISDFDRFDEGFKDFIKSVGKGVNKLLKKGVDLFRSNAGLEGALKEYDIEVEKIDNYTYKFYHADRLIARIFQPEGDEGDEMNRPVFKLYIYLYETEVKKTKNYSMKDADPDKEIGNELGRQGQKPYFKLAKRSFNIEWLVQVLYEWWATKTKSGRESTNKMNRPKQSPTPLRHYSPSIRREGPPVFGRKIFK